MNAKDKVIVITGATSGLGQQTAIDLAKQGARVIITGRDEARAKETVAKMGSGDYVLGDVSTRAGVNAVAAEILKKSTTIDVLLNNAGGNFSKRTQTADGIESTFALNTFGAYILEKELHGALASAKGRVVNVVTGLLDSFKVDVGDLVSPKKFATLQAYGKAKLAGVMMTVEQAKRFEKDGVSVVSVHPGIIMGTRFGGGQPKFLQLIGAPMMRAIGLGATLDEASTRFQIACLGDVPSGSYIVKGKVAPLPKQVNDARVRADVVTLLESLAAGASTQTRAA